MNNKKVELSKGNDHSNNLYHSKQVGNNGKHESATVRLANHTKALCLVTFSGVCLVLPNKSQKEIQYVFALVYLT